MSGADASALPVADGRWYRTEPFRPAKGESRSAVYATAFGPEIVPTIDKLQSFGDDELRVVKIEQP